MKKVLFIAALFCSTATFAQQSTITPAAPGVTYGKTVTADKAITLTSLNKTLSTDSVYQGKVSGEVVEVCKKKGCFMKLKQADGNHVMVRFTDYAFFMPQNIVGKKVVVEGKAKSTETSVERLRHYAADAGKTDKEIAKITQPKKDIQIMADGVLVME
ncbi:DUF4920 domain-containing protein [Mucilaginibacter sp. Bleaf8]|uniref:DUF4920 domain-containing protein n=1 Tax=Mucilaginibacter sp. Bleaf8 TaxID=2834430 RepID=UPI001BCD96E7|nr:DUF4920 domain-containing protein [Mucilaginibacter sp. Bleaf8]MBS7563501.1 DUF4920 domain-containing protein [Mucilaginibacter sp. Bleaf8]